MLIQDYETSEEQSNLKSKMAPLVSVLMPVYNGVAWLKESVDSVLAQTYPNVELIIVNDCSTDGSDRLAESFRRNNTQIIHNKKNAGINGSRNIALTYAQGTYIALLDQDDLWFPQKLRQQMAIIEMDPDVDFVYSDSFYGTDMSHISNRSFEIARPHTENANSHILISNFIPSLTVLFKRDLIEKAGMFDETYTACADYEMLVRLLRYAKTSYVPEPLGLYRLHPKSFTYSNRERQYLEKIRILKRETIDRHYGLMANYHLRIAREAFRREAYFKRARRILSGLFCSLRGPREFANSINNQWQEHKDFQKKNK